MPIREPVYQPVATDSPPRTITYHVAENTIDYSDVEMTPEAGRKNWQTHPGKNKFCCNGRVMMGKNPGIFYLTLGLIIVGMGFFFGFE